MPAPERSRTSRREFIRRASFGGAGVVAAGSLSASAGTATAWDGRATVLKHGTVIDATGRAPRRDATVVLNGDLIVYVGEHRRDVVPRGARIIDLHGKYVIPGLWDMHTHYGYSESEFIPLHIANGVTGIREMWGYAAIRATHRKIESGELLGPRMVIASNLIDGPFSVWAGVASPSATVVDNESGARDAVRQAKAVGADFVKVYSYLSRESMAAITDEARRLGLPVAGHLPWRLPAGETGELGLRCFEHLFGMPIATSSRETELLRELSETPIDPVAPNGFFNLARELDRQGALTHDPAKAARLYARLRQSQVWQSPTLTILRVLSSPAETLLNDPRLKYIHPAIRSDWTERIKARSPSSPEEIARQREFFRFRLRMVGDMYRAGIGIIGGTDCLNPFALPGFGAHDELSLLVEAGLTPLQALQAMTRDAARYLGLERRMGTVTPGKVADLVVLDADPLADIRNSQRVHAVVTRGRLIDQAKREQILADVEAYVNRGGGGAASMSGTAGCGCQG